MDSETSLQNRDALPAPDNETLSQDPAGLDRSRDLSRSSSIVPGRAPGYDILRCLGEGSFGSVWLATETKTGRQVAIKFYTHRKGLDWSLLSREVEKLAVLYTSRNIVGLLDVGWDHDPPYFVMEYLEQGPLSKRLDDGPLPASEAVRIAREVLSALVHAHNSGILHCDLKPANVLIDSGGTPRLGDFGQSRLSTEQNSALGTLFYMAPEQAQLDAVPDARWDVYALGALLYHVLTGAPPYRTPAHEQRLRAAKSLEERLLCYRKIIAESPRPDDHRARKRVDSRLAEIVDGCLERDPHHRLPNAQVVLDLLDQRDQAQAKRPLMVLGIVGPIVFLLTMLAIAGGAIPKAVSTAERNLFDRALATDAVAAKILAASVQEEFDVRMTELEDVADSLNAPGQDELRPDLETFLDAWQIRAAQRLEDQDRAADESIFVTDAAGTQIYRQPRDKTIGQNFAYRDYFHGRGLELARGASARPRADSGISMAYRSRSSRQFKVAVAVPIWNDKRTQVVGVLARSINLSDLLNQWEARIQSRTRVPPDVVPADRTRDRFLALVDLRESPPLLLDHPWMSEQESDQLEDEQLKSRLQLTDEQAAVLRDSQHDRDPRYDDPIARTDSRFTGPWLAAFAPVGQTGWIAIVQEKRSVAVEPVNALRAMFTRYGLGALAAVVMMFWLLAMLIRRAAR